MGRNSLNTEGEHVVLCLTQPLTEARLANEDIFQGAQVSAGTELISFLVVGVVLCLG